MGTDLPIGMTKLSSFTVGGSDGKKSAWMQETIPGLISRLGRFPEEGNSYPTAVFLPGESHGQRSLVGYIPWGHKELDMTEQLRYTIPMTQRPFLPTHLV